MGEKFVNGLEYQKGQGTIYCDISEENEIIKTGNVNGKKTYINGDNLIVLSDTGGIVNIYLFNEKINKWCKL